MLQVELQIYKTINRIFTKPDKGINTTSCCYLKQLSHALRKVSSISSRFREISQLILNLSPLIKYRTRERDALHTPLHFPISSTTLPTDLYKTIAQKKKKNSSLPDSPEFIEIPIVTRLPSPFQKYQN